MQSIKLSGFTRELFDDADVAQQAARILQAQLKAQSPRFSDIARQMDGQPESNYKQLQRFMHKVDLKAMLWRLFQSDADFVVGDVTEIARPHARKTDYVGTLKDGKTRGFWTLVLGTPFRGRVLPFHCISYSSRTIAQEATSRNLEHTRALADVKDLLGDKPVVLDREFSYAELLAQFVAAKLHFVIRLNLGSHAPVFTDAAGKRIELSVARGETVMHQNVHYRGQVRVNLIGAWQAGFNEPCWVMSDLSPQRGWQLYLERMKIEQTFRDLKNLLHLDKLMNKQRSAMEQVLALLLLAFSLGTLLGEQFKDEFCAEGSARKGARRTRAQTKAARRKWLRYTGLFILLKLKFSWSRARVKRIVRKAYDQFKALLFPPVRSPV